MAIRAYYSSTQRANMSSEDSIMSAVVKVASSFPLVVVWGLVLPWTTCLVSVLDDGCCVGKVYILSDIGVGFY